MRGASILCTIAALLCGSAASAQLVGDLAPSFNACGHTHADEAQYFATMASDGWTVAEDRDAAIARLSDTFLPVLGPSGVPWEEMLEVRAANGVANAASLIGDRDIYEQDDHLLVIGGYDNDDGAFRLDCWLVLPDATLLDATFEAAEDQNPLPQLRMAAFSGPSHSDGSTTRIMAVQLQPATPADPPLAGRNGLYIQTIVPPNQTTDDTPSEDGED